MIRLALHLGIEGTAGAGDLRQKIGVVARLFDIVLGRRVQALDWTAPELERALEKARADA